MTIYKGYVTPIIWFEKVGRFLNDISTGFLEINTAGIGVSLRAAAKKGALTHGPLFCQFPPTHSYPCGKTSFRKLNEPM